MTDRATNNELRAATVADLTERELIGRIAQRLQPPPSWLLVGIGDDGAVVEPERNRVEVLSVDCLVDGVHFDRAFVPPDAIGHRALAVNLSDLAAMGAAPRLALLSLSLPADLPLADFDGMADGFAALAARHRMHLVGGNLTRTPGPLTIDVTVVGAAKRRQVLTRAGAKAGDELYVTGSLGAAAAGLGMLRSGASSVERGKDVLVDAYLRPQPRVRLGTLVARNRAASACMDLSDGLADAVRQVAESSGLGASIDGDALAIDEAARDWFKAHDLDPIDAAISSGDDYELLFAVHPRLRRRLVTVMRQTDTPVARIGVCTESRELTISRTVDGVARASALPAGFGHFRPFGQLRVVPSDVEGR